MVDGEWIPIIFFLTVPFLVGIVLYFRNQRRKIEAEGSGEYRALAEEALRGQKILLEELKKMNASLQEIERLLREV